MKLTRHFSILRRLILALPLVTLLPVYAGHPSNSPTSHPAIEISFDLIDRNIRVLASIEGREGYFLVDSGSPSLVLNASRLADWENRSTELAHPSHGAGGAVNNAKALITGEFRLASLRVPSLHALYQDLSVLEDKLDTPLLGLIGVDILSRFTVEFDYQNRKIRLFSPNSQLDQESALAQMNYQKLHHLPVVEINVNGQLITMGIDSGAAGAVLSPKWRDTLDSHLSNFEQTEMTGIDGRDQTVTRAQISQFQLSGLTFSDQPVLFAELKLGHELKMDGLLGYDFLSEYRTRINYRNQQISFYANDPAE